MKSLVLAMSLALLVASQGRANLVVNGSFETPDVGSSFGLFPNGGVPGWTGINNEIEIDFTPILSPGVGTPAFDGKQSTEVDDAVKEIDQTITGLTPGSTYTLSWAYGLRPGSGFQALDVTFGGSLVTHDSGTAGPIGTPLIWIPNLFTVTATATSEVLSFTEVATQTHGAGNEVDAVSLVATPTPEPSTFALAGLGGLGLVGYGWRKRRRTVA
jgi:hypothetical protein